MDLSMRSGPRLLRLTDVEGNLVMTSPAKLKGCPRPAVAILHDMAIGPLTKLKQTMGVVVAILPHGSIVAVSLLMNDSMIAESVLQDARGIAETLLFDPTAFLDAVDDGIHRKTGAHDVVLFLVCRQERDR